jgi:hypothetical protein
LVSAALWLSSFASQIRLQVRIFLTGRIAHSL